MRKGAPWLKTTLVQCARAAARKLISGELYHDLGPDHFDRRAKPTQTRRLVTRLQNLGYAVQTTPLAV